MSSASQGLAPREGPECLLVKMGRTGPLMGPRHRLHASKSGDPLSQSADKGRTTFMASMCQTGK